MPLIHQLDDPVYCRDVYLYVGSRRQLANFLRRRWRFGARHIPSKAVAATLFVPTPKAIVYVIWLESWRGDGESYGMLAHECYHVVVAAFDEMRVKLDEEAVAYYLEFMVRQFGESLSTLE